MKVTAAMQTRVEDHITDKLIMAADAFGRTFQFPTISYKQKGTTAGTANNRTQHVDFNSVLLMENEQVFIDRTVTHELAHLIDATLNPELYGYRYGKKRSVHGKTFKHIMITLGADPSRCHSYDVTSVRKTRAPSAKYVWISTPSGETMELGIKRHNKMRTGAARYFPRGMSHLQFTFSHILGESHNRQMKTAPKRSNKPRSNGNVRNSKLNQCRIIFGDLNGLKRSVIINAFVRDAACTPAGAATYYAKIKKES